MNDKSYLIFAGDKYYPQGGGKDLVYYTNSYEESFDLLNQAAHQYDWAQLFDVQLKKIIKEINNPSWANKGENIL